ncbi:MAG: hypothetical protein AABX70_00810 [Nanoarchaeota archaeon]
MTEQPNPNESAKKNGAGAILQGFATKAQRRAASLIAAGKAYLAQQDPTAFAKVDGAQAYAAQVMGAVMNTLPISEEAGLMDRVGASYGILGTDADAVAARVMQSATEHGGIADPDDISSFMANAYRRAFERTARGLASLIGEGTFGGLEQEVQKTTSAAELVKAAASGVKEAYQRYMGRQLQESPVRG